MVLPFSDAHNMVANLNASHPDAKDFKQIVNFLRQSEIQYAITANVPIFENHIRSFWSTAQFNIRDDRRFINATIEGKVLEITEHTIRHILKLESRETYEMSNTELVAILHKMGYEGDAYNLRMIKSQVGYNWRFLWHIIIHVFAARKAGWDNLTLDLAKGMACLCLGRPFNWARFILENMKANAQGSLKNKFLLYPRFLELIIMEKLKDIKFEGRTLVLSTMRDRVWRIMKTDHQRSAFSGRFTPLFYEMVQIVGGSESESEEEEEEETGRRKNMIESSETESASPTPMKKGPRIILKKSSVAPHQKRHRDTSPEAVRPKRIRSLRESPPPTVQSESVEDKSLKDLIVKLANDFEIFRKEVSIRVRDNTDEIWKLRTEVGRLSGLIEQSLKGKRTGDDADEAVEDVIVLDEPSEAEKKKEVDVEAGMKDIDESGMELDLSFLDEQRVPAGSEVILAEADQSVRGAIIAKSPSWTIKEFYGKGKGKEIAEDVLCGFKPYKPEIQYNRVAKEELLAEELSVLLPWTLEHKDPRVVLIKSKVVYANLADNVIQPDLKPVWISNLDDMTKTDEVGTSESVLVEDVDVEKELMEEKLRMELNKRIKDIEKDGKMIVMAEKREVIRDRMKVDENFKSVVERMLTYLGDNADGLWYRTPDEIIRECFERDCTRIVTVIYESFKIKPQDHDQVKSDLLVNVSTLKASQLKEFLRRYDFASYQINRMSIDQMIEEAKEIQLRLLKKISRVEADKLLDEGMFDVPKDFENRARFFSSQFPQLSTHRIVHWKFDEKKGCYMVKRVTGATHVFYSANEVARLTEEDLYELADLRIDDESDSDEVFQFCRFLKRQKKRDFEAVNFSHQDSIRPHTIAYLRSEGMSLREILKDQYLCLKYEHIPKMSAGNLLDDLKRWFLDDKTFELVFERSVLETIKIYHPAELNLFTKDDLIKISTTSPHGKREWNAPILEMIVCVAENLIKRFPVSSKPDVQIEKVAEKRKTKSTKKKTQEPGRRSGGVHIQD